MSNNIEAELEYQKRLEREKAKAREKYGDACTDPLGNLEYDAQDYAINELVGMDRYAEIVIARAELYNKNDGISLGETIRMKVRELAMQLIAYRMSLLEGGINLGRPEYGEQN